MELSEYFNQLKKALSQYDIDDQVDELVPPQYKLELADWKIKLEGYVKALVDTHLLEKNYLDELYAVTGLNRKREEQRAGRDHKYSIDIATDSGKSFNFDVPAMNPFDAYSQLSKRTSYRSIPGISAVSVFKGLGCEREDGQKPLEHFEQDALICVTSLF